MGVNNELKESIMNGDVMMTRIILKDSLVVDPTFVEFDEMLSYAEGHMENLYDEHDGEELIYDQTHWTKDYMDQQMVTVVNNFSVERVDVLKSICKSLFSSRVSKIEKDRINTRNEYKITKKQAGVGLTVGGTVTAAVGIVASKPIIIAAGATIAVVGGVMILTDK